jgi:hypothetical protein
MLEPWVAERRTVIVCLTRAVFFQGTDSGNCDGVPCAGSELNLVNWVNYFLKSRGANAESIPTMLLIG